MASSDYLFLFLPDCVFKVDCGNRDGKLVCGRRVLVLVYINLALDWIDVPILPVIYGDDATLQFDGLGDIC